jgi:agmatinase
MSALLRRYHPAHDIDIFDHVTGADCGDASVVPGYIDASYELMTAAVHKLQASGARTVCLGGDHSVALAELRAIAAVHGPVALVLFDAHTDTRQSHVGQPFGHGTPFRRAVEEHLVDPARSIQVGIRGGLSAASDLRDAEALGYEIVSVDEVRESGMAAVAHRILERVGAGKVFLSFDVDVLDPAFAPGTGTPTIGGLSSAEAESLLRPLAPMSLVGVDVVEVAPPYDSSGITALAAASIAWETIALMAVAKRATS